MAVQMGSSSAQRGCPLGAGSHLAGHPRTAQPPSGTARRRRRCVPLPAAAPAATKPWSAFPFTGSRPPSTQPSAPPAGGRRPVGRCRVRPAGRCSHRWGRRRWRHAWGAVAAPAGHAAAGSLLVWLLCARCCCVSMAAACRESRSSRAPCSPPPPAVRKAGAGRATGPARPHSGARGDLEYSTPPAVGRWGPAAWRSRGPAPAGCSSRVALPRLQPCYFHPDRSAPHSHTATHPRNHHTLTLAFLRAHRRPPTARRPTLAACCCLIRLPSHSLPLPPADLELRA